MTLTPSSSGFAESMLRRLFIVLIAALVPATIAPFATLLPVPTPTSPYPLVSVLLQLNGSPTWSVALVACTALLLSCAGVLFGARVLSIRVITGLLVAVTTISVVYFLLSVPRGLEHQGLYHTSVLVVANVAIAVAAWALWWKYRRSHVAKYHVLIAVVVISWLFTCAFPYLGELI